MTAPLGGSARLPTPHGEPAENRRLPEICATKARSAGHGGMDAVFDDTYGDLINLHQD
jgi:hypothetical protein